MTRIVALGGTVNPGSSTEQALRLAAMKLPIKTRVVVREDW